MWTDHPDCFALILVMMVMVNEEIVFDFYLNSLQTCIMGGGILSRAASVIYLSLLW